GGSRRGHGRRFERTAVRCLLCGGVSAREAEFLGGGEYVNSKSRRLFSSGPSLPGGADSQRPAAVKGAGEPRRSEPLTARTAGKESRREEIGRASCRERGCGK